MGIDGSDVVRSMCSSRITEIGASIQCDLANDRFVVFKDNRMSLETRPGWDVARGFPPYQFAVQGHHTHNPIIVEPAQLPLVFPRQEKLLLLLPEIRLLHVQDKRTKVLSHKTHNKPPDVDLVSCKSLSKKTSQSAVLNIVTNETFCL